MVVRITKEFKFEMAHALFGHDGPCKNIHGHSYCLFVTLKGNPLKDSKSPKNGMLIDFSDLTKIIKNEIIQLYDHSLVLDKKLEPSLLQALHGQKLILVDFQPTCENLVAHFAEKLRVLFPPAVELHHLLLKETESSCAEWYAEDNP